MIAVPRPILLCGVAGSFVEIGGFVNMPYQNAAIVQKFVPHHRLSVLNQKILSWRKVVRYFVYTVFHFGGLYPVFAVLCVSCTAMLVMNESYFCLQLQSSPRILVLTNRISFGSNHPNLILLHGLRCAGSVCVPSKPCELLITS